MPTEAENIQYLYLVLTNDGPPSINWDAVGTALDLKKGAVTKRWSRLKQAMEKGEAPGGSTYQFLWLCVKHSTRDKALNWPDIAAKCNTTAGAASKRYSRMKQAFDQGVAAPGSSPTKNTPTKPKATPRSTPKKTPTKAFTASGYDDGEDDDDDDVEATPAPKRKRASPKKKTPALDEQEFKEFKLEPEGEDDDEDAVSSEADKKVNKRAKVGGKAKATPKGTGKRGGNAKTTDVAAAAIQQDYDIPTPTTEATTLIKPEHEDSHMGGDVDADAVADDTFFDAHEAPLGDDLMEDLLASRSGSTDDNRKYSSPPHSRSISPLVLPPASEWAAEWSDLVGRIGNLSSGGPTGGGR
ncbi:hypothetical protein N0V83_006682 [Neocucurbitaria cava]|uniref:Myb-like DNA-binding domain-containing protein n=1 Tax=Neocucurbitaria cava TaxID=798079 RepID=A0A9W9CL81_9PLEO|nr:hypothetical protein N0V83_006682 [Neocucurbitaria cava]